MSSKDEGTSYTQGEHEVDAAEPVTVPEPTEPGFYRYSGGAQTMIFRRGYTGGWEVIHENGEITRCEWGYIAQALGVYDLVKIGSEGTRDVAYDLLFVRGQGRGVHTIASAGFTRYQPPPTLGGFQTLRTPSGIARDLYELDPSERAVLATWCRRIVDVLEGLDS